jgi:hypothetical protein
MNGTANRFSLAYRPGATNRQTWNITRDDDAGEQGDLQIEQERFGGLRVDEMAALGQHPGERHHDELVDGRDEQEGDGHPDAHGDERLDEPLPELVEMLQKRHLAAGVAVVLLVVPAVGQLRIEERRPWREAVLVVAAAADLRRCGRPSVGRAGPTRPTTARSRCS